jgi:hypothetical protein
MTPTSHTRPAFSTLAALTLGLLSALSLPAVAGPTDSVVDVRPETAAALPPTQLEVPEPGTLALVGIGLVGLAWLRRPKG